MVAGLVDDTSNELSRDLAGEFDSVADLYVADIENPQRADGIDNKKVEKRLDEL